jgi:hypothetical protein
MQGGYRTRVNVTLLEVHLGQSGRAVPMAYHNHINKLVINNSEHINTYDSKMDAEEVTNWKWAEYFHLVQEVQWKSV